MIGSRHFLIAFLILCSTLAARPAEAWNAAGHRAIAMVAWNLLDRDDREALVRVIEQHERYQVDFADWMPDRLSDTAAQRWAFAQAAVWPDIARNQPRFHRDKWHYINLPVYLSSEDEQQLAARITANRATELPADAGFHSHELNIVQALKLSVKSIRDPQLPARHKATYVCWVMHLVGDLHQPLHSAALFGQPGLERGDRGGNLIRLRDANLHYHWDNLLGGNRQSINQVAARALRWTQQDELRRLGASAREITSFESWLAESHQVAGDYVYTEQLRAAVRGSLRDEGDRIEVQVSDRYFEIAGDQAARRAVMAGYRLARLLDDLADGLRAAPIGSGR